MSAEKAALALWAKSGDPFHPLLAHMLDTAAVAQAVLFREPSRTLALYAEDWGLSVEEAVAWVALLVGLHDLGKASPVFQAAWEEGARRVREAGLDWDRVLDPCAKSRSDCWVAHGVFTELFLRSLLKEKGLARRVAHELAVGLGAHHGFPATHKERERGDLHLSLERGPWKEARAWLLDQLAQRLGVVFPRVKEVRPEAVLRVMALASFADWVASDPGFFPYGRDPLAPDYYGEAQDLAAKALERLGWRPFHLPARRDFQELFPFPPNPLQATLPQVLGSPKEPVLVLVEAPMGMGKTEAALFAHHLLQQSLCHRGLYVGLPTQATANGLFPRV
jgi:CRISPR-associated endonuclease/helicase Cas3